MLPLAAIKLLISILLQFQTFPSTSPPSLLYSNNEYQTTVGSFNANYSIKNDILRHFNLYVDISLF